MGNGSVLRVKIPVFTNLNTRILIVLEADEPVRLLEGAIERAHSCCYPEKGSVVCTRVETHINGSKYAIDGAAQIRDLLESGSDTLPTKAVLVPGEPREGNLLEEQARLQSGLDAQRDEGIRAMALPARVAFRAAVKRKHLQSFAKESQREVKTDGTSEAPRNEHQEEAGGEIEDRVPAARAPQKAETREAKRKRLLSEAWKAASKDDAVDEMDLKPEEFAAAAAEVPAVSSKKRKRREDACHDRQTAISTPSGIPKAKKCLQAKSLPAAAFALPPSLQFEDGASPEAGGHPTRGSAGRRPRKQRKLTKSEQPVAAEVDSGEGGQNKLAAVIHMLSHPRESSSHRRTSKQSRRPSESVWADSRSHCMEGGPEEEEEEEPSPEVLAASGSRSEAAQMRCKGRFVSMKKKRKSGDKQQASMSAAPHVRQERSMEVKCPGQLPEKPLKAGGQQSASRIDAAPGKSKSASVRRQRSEAALPQNPGPLAEQLKEDSSEAEEGDKEPEREVQKIRLAEEPSLERSGAEKQKRQQTQASASALDQGNPGPQLQINDESAAGGDQSPREEPGAENPGDPTQGTGPAAPILAGISEGKRKDPDSSSGEEESSTSTEDGEIKEGKSSQPQKLANSDRQQEEKSAAAESDRTQKQPGEIELQTDQAVQQGPKPAESSSSEESSSAASSSSEESASKPEEVDCTAAENLESAPQLGNRTAVTEADAKPASDPKSAIAAKSAQDTAPGLVALADAASSSEEDSSSGEEDGSSSDESEHPGVPDKPVEDRIKQAWSPDAAPQSQKQPQLKKLPLSQTPSQAKLTVSAGEPAPKTAQQSLKDKYSGQLNGKSMVKFLLQKSVEQHIKKWGISIEKKETEKHPPASAPASAAATASAARKKAPTTGEGNPKPSAKDPKKMPEPTCLTPDRLEDLAAQGLSEDSAKILTRPFSYYPKSSPGTKALRKDMKFAARQQLLQEGKTVKTIFAGAGPAWWPFEQFDRFQLENKDNCIKLYNAMRQHFGVVG